jgi:hypothetical protein
MNDELLVETLAFLRSRGLEPHVVEHNRHIKVRFTDTQQRKRIVILSCSPSSRFAIKKNRSLLRRILRER